MLENTIFIFLNGLLFKNPFFDKVVLFIANPFGFVLLGVVFIYFFVIEKKPKKFFIIALIVLLALLGSELLKFIFHTPRPFLVNPEIVPLFRFGSFDSFPSGHATIFSAIATAMYLENKKFGVWFIVAAILIGLSRVIAGVHYPHDILAGYTIGVLGVLFGYKIWLKLRNNSKKKKG